MAPIGFVYVVSLARLRGVPKASSDFKLSMMLMHCILEPNKYLNSYENTKIT
jgi:hypothetical protein